MPLPGPRRGQAHWRLRLRRRLHWKFYKFNDALSCGRRWRHFDYDAPIFKCPQSANEKSIDDDDDCGALCFAAS